MVFGWVVGELALLSSESASVAEAIATLAADDARLKGAPREKRGDRDDGRERGRARDD